MVRNWLAVAVRHLGAQKLYSAINVIGLAVGLACFILIGLFIRHELSFDDYHSRADRLYRISADVPQPDGSRFALASTPPAIAPLLEADFPEIEQAARISTCGQSVLVSDESGDRSFLEDRTAADPGALAMFDFEWLAGNRATALDEPFSIVLTESTARKYFGAGNALGQTLVIDNVHPVEVTGIIRDLPDNTHLSFDLLVSMGFVAAVNGPGFLQVWNMNCYYTYVLLEPGASIEPIQNQSEQFFERHMPEGSARAQTDFAAIALPDVHLSPYQLDMRPQGSLATIYAAGAIAAFILLIACINFMNLATARAAQRAKEVGVRKAVGASRSRLVAQFLGESLLLASIAMALGIALVELLLPAFAGFVRKDLSFAYLTDASTIASLSLLVLAVGLAAGSYPAFYLSAFTPSRVLKGNVTRGTAAATFRRALVVFQFSISIALVIAAAIVYEQLRFARNIELGYEKDRIVVVSAASTRGLANEWEVLKREWLESPGIAQVTRSAQTPGDTFGIASGVRVEGGDLDPRPVTTVLVDHGFFETYDIDVLAGRGFSERFETDRLPENPQAAGSSRPGIVINALAAREHGLTAEEAVGKWIEVGLGGGPLVRGTIVGVVEDIYFESVHNPIRPFIYALSPERILGRAALTQASIRITGRDLDETLAHVDATWRRVVPDQPVSRRFLDADFQALYDAEQREGRMLAYFSLLAVFVACLGLFGLASFTTEQRTKEIGVRKVMGGSVLDIVRLFAGEFGRLVLLANVIAWPTAYFLMQRWLEAFAYRIDMSVLVFAGSALFALVVALVTVGVVSARAASVNPILSLRYE